MDEGSGQVEQTNKSVGKAVRLLRALAALPRNGATVTVLAKAAGLSRPTAFRLLSTLEHEGLVERTDSIYTLGWELARLGRRADPYSGLVALARPLLQQLADTFNESTSLSVPNSEGGLDLIADATGSHVLGFIGHNMVGQHYPLHASSTGKVLLAYQPPEKLRTLLPERLEAFTPQTITDHEVLRKELVQVREQGFAIIDNELEPELLSLSRPILDDAGTLVAVLTLNGPRSRLSRDRIPQALQEMQAAIDRMTKLFWRGGQDAG